MEWPSKDIRQFRFLIQNIVSFEEEVKTMRAKMEAMAGVYDNLQEKMHDVDKSM